MARPLLSRRARELLTGYLYLLPVAIAIVIGARTKNVSVERAPDHVFGYTVAEDISDRDLQSSEKQFARAKSFDTYSPIGPFVYAGVDVRELLAVLAAD